MLSRNLIKMSYLNSYLYILQKLEINSERPCFIVIPLPTLNHNPLILNLIFNRHDGCFKYKTIN